MEIKRFLTIAAIMTGCAMVQTMTAQEEINGDTSTAMAM